MFDQKELAEIVAEAEVAWMHEGAARADAKQRILEGREAVPDVSSEESASPAPRRTDAAQRAFRKDDASVIDG